MSNDQASAISERMWKTMLRRMPAPVVALGPDRRILVVSEKAAKLLNIDGLSLEGQDADASLCLTTEHHRWIPGQDKIIDTRLAGARILFEVSHVCDADLQFEVTYLTITSVERAGLKLYDRIERTHDAADDDEEDWKAMQYSLLDELPAMIVAVSKDGRHVYQNATAHNRLGPIASPSAGLDEWIKQQYKAAKYPDGSTFFYQDLPLYQAAIKNIACDSREVYFGRFIFQLSGRPLYDKKGQHYGGVVFSQDVTEIRAEAEKKEQIALKQSDVKFREITNSMEQIVWVSTSGAVEYFNQRWYEYTGAAEADSLGTSYYNFLHPDDKENTMNNWLLMLESDQDRFVTQHRIRGTNGQYRWFLARAIAARDETGRVVNYLGTSTDITQITEALEEAKTAKEQLFNIMQIAHVHYFVVSHDFIMTSAFLAGGDLGKGLYGRYNGDQLIRRDVRNVLSASVMKALQTVLDGKEASSTTESEVDGLWWKTQFKVMKDSSTGAILGAVGTAIDINEEKLKDEQLARASTERLVAVQNSKFKGEFLARMSHEIRTPIGGILGMVELMKDVLCPESGDRIFYSPAKGGEAVEYLESIRRCGDALLVIINDILDFSKIEVGKMDIENNAFDLRVMVNDVYIAAKHGPHLQQGVSLDLDYRIPNGLIFKGDPNRLRQILTNLLSNALKFTESGRVICKVQLYEENATANKLEENDASSHPSRRVQFTVIDTGIGIPKDALDRLFNPFVQADSSTARKFGGTGLGLSISRQLVKLMSGALNLESTPAPLPGHGSVATCVIPMELSSEQELHKMAPELAKFTGHRKVLLVEDNKINQIIAKKTLQKLGLDAHVAENGQEAIDYLLSTPAETLPEIVLMDCQMPLLDGYEATAQIRKLVNSRIRNLPIVAMTASAISGDREKCLAAGMNDYVSKPINSLLLAQTLSKYLDDRLPEPNDHIRGHNSKQVPTQMMNSPHKTAGFKQQER